MLLHVFLPPVLFIIFQKTNPVIHAAKVVVFRKIEFHVCDVICNGEYLFPVQLTPPGPVDVLQTQLGVNVSWQSGYTGHIYFQNKLRYEVLLQELRSEGNKVRVILQSTLTPTATPTTAWPWTQPRPKTLLTAVVQCRVCTSSWNSPTVSPSALCWLTSLCLIFAESVASRRTCFKSMSTCPVITAPLLCSSNNECLFSALRPSQRYQIITSSPCLISIPLQRIVLKSDPFTRTCKWQRIGASGVGWLAGRLQLTKVKRASGLLLCCHLGQWTPLTLSAPVWAG